LKLVQYQTSWTANRSTGLFSGSKVQGFLSVEHCCMLVTGGMDVKHPAF